MATEVILVDEQDRQIGTAEKLAAHQSGALHRAFSLFVFNSRGELLIQKRAAGKYHSGGLWSNTCCSHPRPGEQVIGAVHQRLQEEMGFDCPVRPVDAITYRTAFDNGLIEHEFDHLLVGEWDGRPAVNPAEAEDWRWIDPPSLTADMARRPDAYTFWFRLAWPKITASRSRSTSAAG